MLQLHNLTHRTGRPRTLVLYGREVPAGGMVMIEDTVELRHISGLLRRGEVWLGELPECYTAQETPEPPKRRGRKPRRS